MIVINESYLEEGNMLGAIEAGGTKFVCAVGDEKANIVDRIQIPTTVPEKTIPQVVEFFNKYNIEAIGIGSFGPIDVNRESSTFGHITSTPKTAWRNFPFIQSLKDAFDIPIGFNTDVNAAALGEVTLGAAKGLDSCLYITVWYRNWCWGGCSRKTSSRIVTS